jgi:hypothetical protein
MAFTTFVDGTTAVAEEVNANFKQVLQVYTADGFDSSKAWNGAGTAYTEGSHEMDEIPAASVTGCTYVKITIFGLCYHNGNSGTSGMSSEIKIQVQELGGSYADDMAYQTIFMNGITEKSFKSLPTTTWYHTLTAGEIANGLQFKIWSKSNVSGRDTGNAGTCSYDNVQTVISVVP